MEAHEIKVGDWRVGSFLRVRSSLHVEKVYSQVMHELLGSNRLNNCSFGLMNRVKLRQMHLAIRKLNGEIAFIENGTGVDQETTHWRFV